MLALMKRWDAWYTLSGVVINLQQPPWLQQWSGSGTDQVMRWSWSEPAQNDATTDAYIDVSTDAPNDVHTEFTNYN